MRQDTFGEVTESRGSAEMAHQCVEVLGVVLLLADLGGAADGREPIERVRRTKRQVEAEERIAVAGADFPAGSWSRSCRLTGTLTRTAPSTMVGLDPAPQPARDQGQHHVVHRSSVYRPGNAPDLAKLERRQGHRAPGTDVAVEWRPQPRLRSLPRGGRQPAEPVMRSGLRG